MTTRSSFVPPSPLLVALYRQLASIPMHQRQLTSDATLTFLSGSLTREGLKKFVLFLTERYEHMPDCSITTRVMRYLAAFLRVLCHSYEFHLQTSLIIASNSKINEVLKLTFGNLIPVSLLKVLLDRFIDLVELELQDPLNFSNQADPVHLINLLPIQNPQVSSILKSKLIVTNFPLNFQLTIDPKEPIMLSPDLNGNQPLHRLWTNGPPRTSTHLITQHTTDPTHGTLSSYKRFCLSCDLSLCDKKFKKKSKKWNRTYLFPIKIKNVKNKRRRQLESITILS